MLQPSLQLVRYASTCCKYRSIFWLLFVVKMIPHLRCILSATDVSLLASPVQPPLPGKCESVTSLENLKIQQSAIPGVEKQRCSSWPSFFLHAISYSHLMPPNGILRYLGKPLQPSWPEASEVSIIHWTEAKKIKHSWKPEQTQICIKLGSSSRNASNWRLHIQHNTHKRGRIMKILIHQQC